MAWFIYLHRYDAGIQTFDTANVRAPTSEYTCGRLDGPADVL